MCYENQPWKGLRFNRKKARIETIEKLIREWSLKPVPWCSTGYYYADPCRPGLSFYHDAGVFYIQEPSAMSVVEEALINETDIVLDLCAAPGGKSTALAERCRFLIANEILPNRAKILSSNIERLGFDNVIVTNAAPDRICSELSNSFSVVLVDAPCSGEGMMRKDETAVNEWSEENVLLCVSRQREILSNACQAVMPGGKLVYSTCTFDPRENEDQIRNFLKEHPDFKLSRQLRMMPHKIQGEGHFLAVMVREGTLKLSSMDQKSLQRSFEQALKNTGIHIIRSGLVPGEVFIDKKKNKIYEPSHAEIMASDFEHCQNGINLLDEDLVRRFLHGEALSINESNAMSKGSDGFLGIYYDGYPLGLGKKVGNTVKNHLPKGLRHTS